MKNILKSYLNTIYQTIELTAAALLLTGQITIRSVIITSGGGARVSVSGPLFGLPRSEAKPEAGPGAALVLDGADVIVAFLLILGEANLTGMFIQSGHFTLLVGGPAFGDRPWEAYVPEAADFFQDYRDHLLNRYKAESPQRDRKRRD